MAEQAVKNVIFDMDGVIFDTERVYIECCIEAAKALPVPEEQVYETCVKCTGTNEFQTIEFFHRDFSPFLTEAECQTLRDESVRFFKKRYTEKLIPMKAGVVELLEYLKEQGIRIGLASSTRKDIVERELADAGILHYFESVTGGDVVKISKPNPEIYLIACDKMQEPPEECFAIEDSFNGIRAAKAAGMRPIMVPDIVQPTDEIRQMAETVCSDLFGVIDYLRNLQ